MRNVIFPLLLLIMASCQEGIIVQPSPPGMEGINLDDIPVPLGFKQDRFQSYGHIYPKFKVCTLLYRGESTPEIISNFYKKVMPKNGWRLSKQQKDRMIFIKDIEKCEIQLIPLSGRLLEIRIKRGLK